MLSICSTTYCGATITNHNFLLKTAGSTSGSTSGVPVLPLVLPVSEFEHGDGGSARGEHARVVHALGHGVAPRVRNRAH